MVSPIRLASIGPSTVLTVAIVLPPLTRFHSIDLYPTPLPSVPVKLEALPLKAIFKSAKRPGPFLVPGFRLDPTSSLGLLILLGFLSFLHFFDAAEWTTPGHEEEQGDQGDQQSHEDQQDHGPFASCLRHIDRKQPWPTSTT